MRSDKPKDVILVAHGHLTRAFAKRWLGYELAFPLRLMMEPGGVGILSYDHHSTDEPALLLGMGFPLQD
jgi:broad specificity phosphatase PhoE